MKNSFLIIISVLIPLNCFAAWFKLFSITNADLFIDTKSISRDQNTSITLGLSHVCSFLGVINDGGLNLSHHWYSLGIRKRL